MDGEKNEFAKEVCVVIGSFVLSLALSVLICLVCPMSTVTP